MNAEADSTPAESTATEPAKSGSNVTRIVLLVLLLVAIVALIIDQRAKGAAQELNDKLIAEMDSARANSDKELPTKEEIHQLTGQEPSESYEHEEVANTLVEEYSWRGAFREYTVYVYIKTHPDERLDNVSLNQLLGKESF